MAGDPIITAVGRIEFGPHREQSTAPDTNPLPAADIFTLAGPPPLVQVNQKLDRIIELLEQLVQVSREHE